MKITNPISTFVKKIGQEPVHSVQPKIKLQTIQDTFERRVNPELPIGNILTVDKNQYGEHIFIDGNKEVGISTFDIVEDNYANPELYPKDWFVEGVAPKVDGKKKLKPYMFVHQLVMYDRMNEKELVKRGKKYGTMVIQHLLNIAQKNECDSRIVLHASKLGQTGFAPGRFYHKMGFSLPTKTIKNLEEIEKQYTTELSELLSQGIPEEKAKEVLKSEGLYLPEKKDGRYIVDNGYLIMTNPECALNYPLK